MVAQLLFVTQRGRPDLQTAVSFLTKRVQAPDEDDYKKLARTIKFIRRTMFLCLTVKANDLDQNHWFVDGAFAVHPGMTSHTGAYMTFGKGMQADQALPRQHKRKAVGVEWTGVHQQTHPPHEHRIFLRRERGQAPTRHH